MAAGIKPNKTSSPQVPFVKHKKQFAFNSKTYFKTHNKNHFNFCQKCKLIFFSRYCFDITNKTVSFKLQSCSYKNQIIQTTFYIIVFMQNMRPLQIIPQQ
eukprot:TRINITY_DN5201_c0_g1_i2.p3 TRINITY_DN5201_c0_g1~~TRINITY_DN5201_c0_g1_i2.p3  ORF type:complete len:100 (-),score=2.16 TRINITY_DN5201_c0_g1_i2:228-527(-)